MIISFASTGWRRDCTKEGKRVFDVKVDGVYVIVSKDIVSEVPTLTANGNTLVVEHAGRRARWSSSTVAAT